MARPGSITSASSSGSPEEVVGVRELAEPQALSLEEVLKSYEQPINEEQAWAVCYQCCRGLSQVLPGEAQRRTARVKDPGSIILHKDGAVTVFNDPEPNDSDRKHPQPTCTEGQIVQSLGFAIYRALDWGLDENEERELSPQLEQLIDLMANGDLEGSNGTADEGYGQDEEEEENEGLPRTMRSFEQVMKACASHLTDPTEAPSHYQAVCRALFLETKELMTFLVKIQNAKEMLKKMRDEEESNQGSVNDLDNLRHTDWARLWVQLMRELRNGVKLKKVQEKQYNPLPTEFQLTPFEMLMQDIRAQKFKLRKVMVDGNIPPRVKKDAHELILDFIRSRPPLKPVSERNLRPKPQRQHTLHEKILEEIKQERKLRPVETEYRSSRGFGSLPCIVNAYSSDMKSSSCINLSTPESSGTTTRQRPRVLLKAPTLAEMEEMNISEVLPQGPALQRACFKIALTREPFGCSVQDLSQLMSWVNLPATVHLSQLPGKPLRNVMCCKLRDGENQSSLPAGYQATCVVQPFSPERRSLSSVEEKTEIDSVSSECSSKHQWLEFSHPVESLALTIEEVINVRRVLVKAELEKFLPSKELYNNLKKGRVCCCCKLKFPLFSWPSTCMFCKRSVCSSCSIKMKTPSKKLAHIPVYTVGFECVVPTTSHAGPSKKSELFQLLRTLSSRSAEEEFPHLYANGCSLKDVCADCAKFVADVIQSSRKSLDILNTPSKKSRQTQSLYTHSGRMGKLK
uniref:Spire type actin nucleation factor 2 n=1 Tax=Latimeria chalumnae TaxID=7897 RepID=H3AS66_LATCH